MKSNYTFLKELLISLKYLQKYMQQYLDLWQHPFLIEASHNHLYPQKNKKIPQTQPILDL